MNLSINITLIGKTLMPKINKTNPALTELNFREFCKDVKTLKDPKVADERFIGFDYKNFIHTFKTVAYYLGCEPGRYPINFFDHSFVGTSGSVVFKEKVMPNIITYKEHVARGQKTAYEELYDAVVINLKPIHKGSTIVRLAISSPTYSASQVAIQLKFFGSLTWTTIHVKPHMAKEVFKSLNF